MISALSLRAALSAFILAIWLMACAPASVAAAGSEWPQFLGPARNGVYPGEDIAPWPRGGRQVLWRKKVGAGWSSPVSVEGKVLCFHRVEDKERLDCLDAATGTSVWSSTYPTAYRDDFGFDEGPRATPTIVDGKIYTFGAEGALHCWSFDQGKDLWAVDTRSQFGQGKGFFGMVCSPLVEGDKLILNIGAKGAGIVAFDRSTGKPLWKTGDDEAGYSSPVAATIGKKRYILSLTRAGLVALDPESGKVYFSFPWRSPMNASVNAATPLVIDDQIFISASYQTGATLLRFHEFGPEKIWAGENILSNHYSTCVYQDGYLYGFDGRQEMGQRLRCVDIKTGDVKWTKQGTGAGTIILAGDRLIILGEQGDLVEASASPAGYKELGRTPLVGFGTRANAAIANGLYFARGKTDLVCVDLRAAK